MGRVDAPMHVAGHHLQRCWAGHQHVSSRFLETKVSTPAGPFSLTMAMACLMLSVHDYDFLLLACFPASACMHLHLRHF
jgi:hypothetical protein